MVLVLKEDLSAVLWGVSYRKVIGIYIIKLDKHVYNILHEDWQN